MIAWLAAAHAHIPVLYTFRPEDDWCGFVNFESQVGDAWFYPGDVILLEPGEYAPCRFHAPQTDTDAEFTVVQSRDTSNPARFVHDGVSDALLDVSGMQVFLLGLRFEGVPAGRAAVRLTDADNVWVRFSEFAGHAGVGVDVVGASRAIWVLDDRFDGPGIAVRAGCDGCAQQVRVRNDILTGTEGVVAGAGVELELTDVVFDGGAHALRLADGAHGFVTGNLMVGVETALSVASGPVVVRNNIAHAGAVALDARGAGPSWTGVRIVGNSFSAGDVLVGGFDDGSFELVDNAALSDLGPGNVDCRGEACWVDAAGWDFTPRDGGPLDGAGQGARDDALYEDFCRQVRRAPHTVGAIQAYDAGGWGPFDVRFKNDFRCVLEAPPGDGFEETGDVTEPARCACATGPVPAVPPWLLLAWWVRRRR